MTRPPRRNYPPYSLISTLTVSFELRELLNQCDYDGSHALAGLQLGRLRAKRQRGAQIAIVMAGLGVQVTLNAVVAIVDNFDFGPLLGGA